MQTLRENLLPIAEQIAELAKACPYSLALNDGDRSVSYKELDHRADRFAEHLIRLGLRQQGAVAICMERSCEWIVAALGIMRAGAAYVPIDPAWPDERLRFAVNDSGASILVAHTELLERLEVDAHGLDPYRDASAIAMGRQVEPRQIQPDSLAYVIYTSGSTGVPKGVEITHANLSHLIRWHLDTFGVTGCDRASHLAGLGFDAAVWEIWPALCAGATVCLVDDTVRASPELLQEWMVRDRITIAFVPTVLATPMMGMQWPNGTALRVLLTGGDALHRSPISQLPFQVFNNYGPTECTVVATSSLLIPGSLSPSIGRPIAGAIVYLLNEEGGQVPDGICGEIYIGGDGVGCGYRNLPDATERSFLPDPFAGEPGARMYRTGDLGLRRSDGEIEFRGRLDRQTKIRGQRFELEEIDRVLMHHPSIDFAAVTISEEREDHLVAYVVLKKEVCAPSANEIQELLLRSLPEYMIPASFVQLPAFPLLANGKLDLRMLHKAPDGQLLERIAVRATATPLEQRVLILIQELLQTSAVSADDNFFLAGGHSLLGMQLVMRLRETFGVDVALRQIFEAPTAARLASLIEGVLIEAIGSMSDEEVGSELTE